MNACQACCKHATLKACDGGHTVRCTKCGKRWEQPKPTPVFGAPTWGYEATPPRLGQTIDMTPRSNLTVLG